MFSIATSAVAPSVTSTVPTVPAVPFTVLPVKLYPGIVVLVSVTVYSPTGSFPSGNVFVNVLLVESYVNPSLSVRTVSVVVRFPSLST